PTIIFFFNDTPTSAISTLSLHDALPISRGRQRVCRDRPAQARRSQAAHLPHARRRQDLDPHRQRDTRRRLRAFGAGGSAEKGTADRKSTRLNSSHSQISYAVFCLKKKKK